MSEQAQPQIRVLAVIEQLPGKVLDPETMQVVGYSYEVELHGEDAPNTFYDTRPHTEVAQAFGKALAENAFLEFTGIKNAQSMAEAHGWGLVDASKIKILRYPSDYPDEDDVEEEVESRQAGGYRTQAIPTAGPKAWKQ